MARKSAVSRGPDRPASLALTEPTSARSTALDQTTSRADVDDLDRSSVDDAEQSNDRAIPIQDYANGMSHLSTLRWGYALVFGSASVLAVGLWSILIGPLCEPTGIKVCWFHVFFRSLASPLDEADLRALGLIAAARRPRARRLLQVPRHPPRTRHRLLRHHQLVGSQGQYPPPL